MKKIILSAVIVGVLAIGGAVMVRALSANDVTVTLNNVPEAYVYGGQVDVLGLDFTMKAPGGDFLDDLVVRQEGTAQWNRDLTGAKLWVDDGAVGFQGIAVDRELAKGTWNANINGWSFTSIREPVTAEGARFFVSITTYRTPTSNTTIQLSIPGFVDSGMPMSYDIGDLGVFLRTARATPEAKITNTSRQTIRTTSTDNQAPLIRITEPKAGALFEGRNWILVRGIAVDNGGSSPSKVQVGINRVGKAITWMDATPEVAGFATWEARFFELPVATTFELRVKGEDWIGNRMAESTPIMVTLTE